MFAELGTRWVERLNALDLAIELYEPAMVTLDAIASNREGHWNTESTTKASTLLRACRDPQFLVALHVTCQVLGVTRGLTIKLQSRANDLLKAYQDNDRHFGNAAHQSRREAQGVVRSCAEGC